MSTLPFKMLGSVWFLFKTLIPLLRKVALNWSRLPIKTCLMLQKVYIWNTMYHIWSCVWMCSFSFSFSFFVTFTMQWMMSECQQFWTWMCRKSFLSLMLLQGDVIMIDMGKSKFSVSHHNFTLTDALSMNKSPGMMQIPTSLL